MLPEPPHWDLDAATYERMRSALAAVADDSVAAIIEEVPSYRGPFTGLRGQRIREAVQLALDVFLNVAMRSVGGDQTATATARVKSEAYDLGRGEARAGRPMDALLTAYRIGARVSWRVLSREAIASGMPAASVGQFAEQVFSYIDDLSAASVAGHTDELQTRGRARERLLERIARSLAAGDPELDLRRRAEGADWEPPASLTAVLLPSGNAPTVRAGLDPRTLHVTGDLPGLDEDTALLFVPDLTPGARPGLRRRLDGRCAVLGPTRPWTQAHASLARARRAASLPRDSTVLDTDEHLVELVIRADEDAYLDLRAAALAPLDQLRPAVRGRLERPCGPGSCGTADANRSRMTCSSTRRRCGTGWVS